MAEAASTAPTPAGNPQTALYNETLAALQHQQQTSLAADALAKSEAATAYKTGVQTYNVAEPKALTAEQDKANNAGLLESGINARERGSVLGNYVEKRGALSTKEQSDLNKIALNEQNANATYSLGVKNAATKALEEYKKEQAALAPVEQQPSNTNVPGISVANPGGTPQPQGAPTNAPGLTIKNPGGTAQKNTRSIRQRAARRAA